ncbi:MAG: hypothetical protein N2Z64_05520 [Dictyoglomus thermophilum]|uniref:Lipoprotein n=1 Tax=Dictyoglomus thermophilum TaxID=14 RepID=A0A7C3PRD6_DICTH|nr:hypothetical protein [Dictyoglomus thermophilum]MCX7720726.1 hypothetical protein [Dictyoglomus thermophilum]TYT24138.1 hypothetical protein FY122_00925 [Dictyoglomus thermophilum]
MKKKIIIFLILGLTFISGCARTVTQRPKGYLGINISFYNSLIFQQDNSYYAFIVAFSKDSTITEDPSTWDYFIMYDGDNQKFLWGIYDADSSSWSTSDFSSYGTLLSGNISENGLQFSFKISISLFSELTQVYMKIFFFSYDPSAGDPPSGLIDLGWEYPASDVISINLSVYPFSLDLPSSDVIWGIRIWTE